MGWVETLRAEAAVIAAAPWSFAICAVVLTGLIWAVLNWRYGETIAKLKERVGERDEQIKSLERHGAGGAIAAELADLKKRLEPRRLTEAQRFKMRIALMETTGNIQIQYDVSCSDAERFAQDFQEEFAAAGWETQRIAVVSAFAPSMSGVNLPVENLAQYTTGQLIVAEMLIAMDVPFDVQHQELPQNIDARLTLTTRAT